MTKTFKTACDMCYDWFCGDGRQKDLYYYCWENNLNYDYVYNFVCEHQEDYFYHSLQWEDFSFDATAAYEEHPVEEEEAQEENLSLSEKKKLLTELKRTNTLLKKTMGEVSELEKVVKKLEKLKEKVQKLEEKKKYLEYELNK